MFDESLLRNPIEDNAKCVIFFITLLIAPFFETFIFQYLVFYFGRMFRQKKITTILLSTLFFALAHQYNLIYFFVTVVAGAYYACTFFYIEKKSSNFTSFLFVSLLHALNNFIAFIINITS
ncbi:CPBP family glutamic-type intramembrane protease [Sphingobacterium corticibacter]